jgi:hypothetical protein
MTMWHVDTPIGGGSVAITPTNTNAETPQQ